MILISKCNLATGWTALSNDTVNLSDTITSATNRTWLGQAALEFDKVNGTGNKTYAGASFALNLGSQKKVFLKNGLSGVFRPHDRLVWAVYLSSVANVASAFVQLGTSAAAYYEYRYPDSSIVAAAFHVCSAKLSEPTLSAQGSTGLNWEDLNYLAVGINFDAETDALADIAIGQVYIEKAEEMNATF